MEIPKIIIELEDIITKAVDKYNYQVSSFPAKLPSDYSQTIRFGLSIKPEIDCKLHLKAGCQVNAKKAVEQSLPNLTYKNYKVHITYGGKMWSGPLRVPCDE